MQPTGRLHLGNYLGALKNWVTLQNSISNEGTERNKCLFMIADLHALTIPFRSQIDIGHPADSSTINVRENTIKTAALYIAAGIDPRISPIYKQSDVSAHSELTFLLSCVCPLSWINTMIQFKQKKKEVHSTSLGLYSYPVLMAADILLYKYIYIYIYYVDLKWYPWEKTKGSISN